MGSILLNLINLINYSGFDVDIGGVVVDNTPLNSGGVPERPKGADCKSAGNAFGGSNPPPSISS